MRVGMGVGEQLLQLLQLLQLGSDGLGEGLSAKQAGVVCPLTLKPT